MCKLRRYDGKRCSMCILAILRTLCNQPFLDLLLLDLSKRDKDNKGNPNPKLLGSGRNIQAHFHRTFVCDRTALITGDEFEWMTKARESFFDRRSWHYRKDRLQPRDCKDPSNRSQAKSTASRCEEVYRYWEIFKGPRRSDGTEGSPLIPRLEDITTGLAAVDLTNDDADGDTLLIGDKGTTEAHKEKVVPSSTDIIITKKVTRSSTKRSTKPSHQSSNNDGGSPKSIQISQSEGTKGKATKTAYYAGRKMATTPSRKRKLDTVVGNVEKKKNKKKAKQPSSSEEEYGDATSSWPEEPDYYGYYQHDVAHTTTTSSAAAYAPTLNNKRDEVASTPRVTLDSSHPHWNDAQ